MNCKIIIVFIILLLGLYFIFNNPLDEGFNNKLPSASCPNILIQKGSELYLFNTKLARIPGVNPLKFNNLNEYVEFTKWQRSQGINCPILYLQHTYDAQGNPVYKGRPSPTNTMGGLPDNWNNYMPTGRLDIIEREVDPDPANSPDGKSLLVDANHDDPPYNNNSFPGYDHDNQNIGLNTPLDQMFHENRGGVSANPYDTNWGGHAYTQKLIDSGYYADNEVYRGDDRVNSNTYIQNRS
jgi:hypothetical protein